MPWRWRTMPAPAPAETALTGHLVACSWLRGETVPFRAGERVGRSPWSLHRDTRILGMLLSGSLGAAVRSELRESAEMTAPLPDLHSSDRRCGSACAGPRHPVNYFGPRSYVGARPHLHLEFGLGSGAARPDLQRLLRVLCAGFADSGRWCSTTSWSCRSPYRPQPCGRVGNGADGRGGGAAASSRPVSSWQRRGNRRSRQGQADVLLVPLGERALRPQYFDSAG